MKVDEIKPCPFCGSEDIEIAQTNPKSIWFECCGCGAQTASADHIDLALDNWNLRTSEESNG